MNRPSAFRPSRALGALSLLAIVLVGAPRARAQNTLDREPGYVNFAQIDRWFDAEAEVEIDIRGSLLRMVAAASRSEDPELAVMLGRMRAIQVRTYRLAPGLRTEARALSADLARSLKAQGWEGVVRVRKAGEENVDIFLRTNGDRVSGLMLMVVSPEDGESVFINIVGEVDPEQIGRIGRRFNVNVD